MKDDSDSEMNDNKSNHIISVDEKRYDSDNRSEDYQAYENLVKENIDYELLSCVMPLASLARLRARPIL